MEFFKALPSDQEPDWEALCAQKLSLQMQTRSSALQSARAQVVIAVLASAGQKSRGRIPTF